MEINVDLDTMANSQMLYYKVIITNNKITTTTITTTSIIQFKITISENQKLRK